MLGRIVSNGIALGRRAGSITASNSDSSFDDDSEAGAPINGTPIKFSPSSKGSVSSSENHRSVTSSETRTHDIGQPRSFAERSATRGMATSTSESLNSSQGAPPPTLTLAAYPGPGSTQQRSSSTSSLLPSPIVTGTTQFSGTPPRDGRGSIPGTTTQSFITAMQAMTFNPTEGNLLPAHQVSSPTSPFIVYILSHVLTCSSESPRSDMQAAVAHLGPSSGHVWPVWYPS